LQRLPEHVQTSIIPKKEELSDIQVLNKNNQQKGGTLATDYFCTIGSKFVFCVGNTAPQIYDNKVRELNMY
jgi:hypothetical protein